jgi:dimethylamine/trimethylamine dehydrogenase
MNREARHDILLEPVEIGPKTLRNRFYGVPYDFAAPFSAQGHARQRAVEAEGGWSAVFTGVTSVSPDFEVLPIVDHLWGDADLPALELVCTAVQEHGALAGIELGHGGADAPNKVSRLPAVGPSQLPSWRRPWVVPKAMEIEDIRRIQGDFARAASAAREIGFDIVCLYGAYSYLPAQFLSPYHNQRTDEYGGSWENRVRFWLETLELLRDAVGDSCALTTRIAAAGLSEIGITVEETLDFVRLADPFVDFWDVTVGADWERDTASSRFFSEGYQLEWSGRIREATEKPIVGVGRLNNPDRMAEIVRSGVWDLIGAARPRIADPFLPRKIEEGRYDDIRECTGSNLCVSAIAGMQMACMQNPTAGEQYRRGWHPEHVDPLNDADLDVLVIGAGPAGMECALTLARRGIRRVHLVDENEEVGGALRWVSSLPTLGEWGRVIDYRSIQLRKAKNVEIVLGTRLNSEGALAYGADVVIVATGARWCTDGTAYGTHAPLPGADASLAHVLTPEQVVQEGKRPAGRQVVVYDTDGYYMAPALAEKLRHEDYEVTIVTRFPVVSPWADERMEGRLTRARLRELEIGWHVAAGLDVITSEGPSGHDDQGRELAFSGASTVLVTHRLSYDGLYHELKGPEERLRAERIKGVYRCGDCTAPRTFADAVFEGHRLAREIESPQPGVALPVLGG